MTRYLVFLAIFTFGVVSVSAFRRPYRRSLFRIRRLPKRNICDSSRLDCGLTIEQGQRRFLSSYVQIKRQLWRLKRTSRIPIQIGSLIKNGNNNGLLDIDVPLDMSLAPAVNVNVCGTCNLSPTIREAVICTVTKSTISQRGNKDPTRIGRSTQGREILAARIGHRGGTRVLVVTQLHGNEAASTDAALQFLRKLTRRRFSNLRKLDILFVLRANPDGGEPTSSRADLPPIGQPVTGGKQLFYRFNVDPTAGIAPTESDFLGVVGQGYDLNRYNYGGLQSAIRPVESQAMVCAIQAFRPSLVFDLHGDVQKVLCDLDIASVVPPSTTGGFVFPTIQCSDEVGVPTLLTNRSAIVVASFFADDASVLTGNQFSDLRIGPLFEQRKRLTRNIVAGVRRKLTPRITGRFTRFSQITSSGASGFSDGTLDRGAMAVGAVGSGWEVANFRPNARPVVSSVSIQDGKPVVTTGFWFYDIEPCFMRDNVCLHREILEKALLQTARLTRRNLVDEGGFCDVPVDTGVTINTPASAGFPPNLTTDGTVMLPSSGIVALPRVISGVCPNDVMS